MPRRVESEMAWKTSRRVAASTMVSNILAFANMSTRSLRALVAAIAAALCVTPAAASEPVVGARHMVAAANPHAAEAGRSILRAGGSAVDAAIAMQMVLNVVEPQSSGIGGGAFLLHNDAGAGETTAYDGRETAPAAASQDLFLDAEGEPQPFFEAVVGGKSVGVPGLLRMLEAAHRDHGRLPWKDLFSPAIRLAKDGFEVSTRLNMLVASDRFLATFAEARALFYEADGAAVPAGAVLKNPALAETLDHIAEAGADGFYRGAIAEAIVDTVRGASRNPGALTLADLAGYRAPKREPVCRPYRAWRVCGMPPPTSGGVTLLQTLGILSNFAVSSYRPGSAEAVHLISEASRLAFADRARYLADPDFVEVPVDALLDPEYLRSRAAAIRMWKSMGPAAAGEPSRQHGALAPGDSLEAPSTTHLSVVDGAGNAVAMTSSIESAFGSRLMVRGFLLNNQLTDFSFRAERDGVAVANRVEPGKRPRSSMSPTLVFDRRGNLVMAVGSPGGSRIIGYVAKTVLAVLDWRLDIQSAIDLPHHVNRNGATDLEAGTRLARIAESLAALGHEVNVRDLNSGLHGIAAAAAGRLSGGADPRRKGIALGD